MHTSLSHLGKIAAQHSDMTTNIDGGDLDDTIEWHCTPGKLFEAFITAYKYC